MPVVARCDAMIGQQGAQRRHPRQRKGGWQRGGQNLIHEHPEACKSRAVGRCCMQSVQNMGYNSHLRERSACGAWLEAGSVQELWRTRGGP